MRVTNIKGFGLRRPVRPSQMGKVLFLDDEDLENHQLFKDAWRENMFMGWLTQNRFSGAVKELIKALERAILVVYNTAPDHNQYTGPGEKMYDELVMLWTKAMDELSHLNEHVCMQRLLQCINENYMAGVPKYMSNDTCNCEGILPEEYHDPGPLPDWLRKELEAQGHPVPDERVIEYNEKELPFSSKFFEEEDERKDQDD